MKTERTADWDPYSAAAREDQIALYDSVRRRCPVAYSEALGWSLFSHEDVMQALEDPATFSSAVSAHLSVPNGMDPPQHTAYRQVIEPCFSAHRMALLEPRCRSIAQALVAELPDHEIDVMASFADEFVLRAQCEFLDWPVALHQPLREWVRQNHAATRSRDRAQMAAVAFEFDRHIRGVLEAQRSAGIRQGDIMSELLQAQVGGKNLTDEEIVSILRNWTVGELATIAASIGIVIGFLAEHPRVQSKLRAEPKWLPQAIDEILRIESPLMSSRRLTRCPVEIHGQTIDRGVRITLMWASANRDERAFEQPQELKLDRDPAQNLLYGSGIHVCPGAPLARLELRVLFEEMLAAVEVLPCSGRTPTRAEYPTGGYSSYPTALRKRSA
jgi:cytochrome P450